MATIVPSGNEMHPVMDGWVHPHAIPNDIFTRQKKIQILKHILEFKEA